MAFEFIKNLFKKKETAVAYPVTTALIAAAGSGSRMAEVCADKLFFLIDGIPVLARALIAYQNADTVSDIIVISKKESVGDIIALCKEYGITKLKAVVEGGATRAESVSNGLKELPKKTRFIAIADGDRPFIKPEEINRVDLFAYEKGAAAACSPVTDTVKMLDEDGNISKTVDRSKLVAMQTPQVFDAKEYTEALKMLGEDAKSATDDCFIYESAGKKVFPVMISKFNIKVTTPEDLTFCEAISKQK